MQTMSQHVMAQAVTFKRKKKLVQYNQAARQQSKQKNFASSSTPQSHDALTLIRNQWHLFVNRGANKVISMNEKTGFAANELPLTLPEHGVVFTVLQS